MRKWSKINKTSILNDRSLLLELTNDFKNTFNEKLNVGCKNCIDDAYSRLISKTENQISKTENQISKTENQMSKTENKCGYVLHAKYTGSIIWKNQPIRSEEMTEKLAIDLIKNHPRGAKLFEKIPKKSVTEVKVLTEKKEASKKIKITQ